MSRQVPRRRTRAEINLDALARNIALLRRLAGGAGVVLPVKADGYGHGQIPVARRAVDEGVALLAVANAQELFALRDAGILHPTLILEDLFPDELPAVTADPEVRLNVSSLDYARLCGAAAGSRPVKLHVNLDTGMGRMGLLSEDPVAAVREIAALPGVEVEGVFSHFPSADEEETSFARQQLEFFREVIEQLTSRGLPIRYAHLANSAGIMLFGTQAAFDLVRPGVSAYGMFPSREVAERMGNLIHLEPCLRLVSSLIKVTRYSREWTVGYGRSYNVGPGSLIGVVPIGYGDGYRRGLSNTGFAVVRGERVPVVGRVSMDMITVDLSELSETPVVGDEVVLIGSQAWGGRSAAVTAEELAERVGTISYEITCGVTPRVPRVYL
ncbi:MAG: alanine racemase [Alkalispirochaetaceae bacterium]